MSDEHEHHHDHAPENAAPVAADDAGSQALAEALGSSFAIVKIVMVLMVVAFFCSGFFTVGPQEKAVILRFGKPVGEGQKALLTSGLHWSLPYPIDEVVRIPITEIQKISSNNGWYFTTPEQELSGEEIPAGPSLNPAIDGYAITADRNIIHTRATLYYHIEQPIDFVFNFASASNTVQNALDNALLFTAAKFNVDDILTRDVDGFREAVQQRVGEIVEQAQLGIVIDNCEVQSIPPRQLQEVFSMVTTARENRNKLLNDAHSYENQVLNQSGAQATSVTNAAAAERVRYVESITAEAKRFGDLLPQYKLNPNLFEQMTFVQAMETAFTNVQDKIYLPQRADGKPRELRLMLNREPPQPKPAANP
ncbi:MAG TPA: protease modulator HflK [Verrucomicrobiae bacterium]|jgi:membrane protease subunit HflK|nr:protease modulator HflK [Verrucomicrobiae bacterium]